LPIQISGVSGITVMDSPRYFARALARNRVDASVLVRYGNWLGDRGDVEGAEWSDRRAIESDPSMVGPHTNLGRLLDQRADIDGAESEYRRAVELAPTSTIALTNLAFFVWDRRGNINEAQALIEGALEQERSAFTIGRAAFFTDEALGELERARVLYEEALTLAPDDSWTNGRYGRFLRNAEDWDGARTYFERATSVEDADRDALLNHAYLVFREGSYDQAISLLRRSLKARKRDPEALAGLASIGAFVGLDAPAQERMYRQVLEWQPLHPEATLNLAQILLQADHNSAEAARMLNDMRKMDLRSELRLELLFYGIVYRIPGFEGTQDELKALVEGGLSPGHWDLSYEARFASDEDNPSSELLAEIAAIAAIRESDRG